MADDDATRARRSYAHRKGDHSLCSPERCEGAQRDAERLAAAQAEARSIESLARSGRALVAEFEVAGLSPVHKRLVIEAARIVDRLDHLDVLIGDDNDNTWLRLEVPRGGDGSEVRVVMNAPLAEARQQAMALRSIAAELRAAVPASRQSEVADPVADIFAAG